MRRLGRVLLLLFVAFSIAVIVMSLISASRQARELGREEKEKISLWAEATMRMANLENPTQDFTFILEVIQRNDNIPVILADELNQPISLRNIPGDGQPELQEVQELISEFSEEHPPIVVHLPSGGVNYVYYGTSEILHQLRVFPYIQLLMIGVLVLLGVLMIREYRRAAQNRIWVGMAKETAHQLGTPISSLVAWHQILSEEDVYPGFVDSLGLDISRLQRVAERFSKMGGLEQLEDTDLWKTIQDSISYMSSRMSRRIDLLLDLPGHREAVAHNAVLLQWVLENLIRNAIDAIEGEGTITLSLRYSGMHAIIDCTDTGKGIPRAKRRAVFNPGYTTKRRGWGLGLSLARRIVRQFHHGSIGVLQSELGKGTTFRIILRRGGRVNKKRRPAFH